MATANTNAPVSGRPSFRMLSINSLNDDGPFIPLADVVKLKVFSAPRRGGKLSPRTVYRWAEHGSNGVQLAVIRVGSVLCTTEAEVILFLERITCPGVRHERTASQARRQIARAEAACEAARI